MSAVCRIEVLLYESGRAGTVLSGSMRMSHVIRWTVNQTRIWPAGQKHSDPSSLVFIWSSSTPVGNTGPEEEYYCHDHLDHETL